MAPVTAAEAEVQLCSPHFVLRFGPCTNGRDASGTQYVSSCPDIEPAMPAGASHSRGRGRSGGRHSPGRGSGRGGSHGSSRGRGRR